MQLLEELASAGVEFGTSEINEVKHYDAQLEKSRHQTLQMRRRLLMEADDEGDDDEVFWESTVEYDYNNNLVCMLSSKILLETTNINLIILYTFYFQHEKNNRVLIWLLA